VAGRLKIFVPEYFSGPFIAVKRTDLFVTSGFMAAENKLVDLFSIFFS
jgi:hypothetical protein